jgi:hypothetical protein
MIVASVLDDVFLGSSRFAGEQKMDPSSPHYLFDPSSPGWVLHRHAKGKHISSEDLDRVLSATPDCAAHPVIVDLIRRGLRGQLRKPAGRPALTLGRKALTFLAADLVRDRVLEWKRLRESGLPGAPRRGLGNPGLTEAAFEEVARELKLGSGRSLANAVSALKLDPLFGE